MTILERLTSPMRTSLLAIVIPAAVFTGLLSHRLTDTPNASDANQNLRAAYNLAYHGIFSKYAEARRPDDYREPLPVAALALYIKIDPRLSSGQSNTSINRSSAVLAVKELNLLWAFLCLVGLGAVVFSSVRPPWLALIAVVAAVTLTYAYFLERDDVINRTLTEIQAATLLVWFAFFSIRALETKKAAWFAAAGILLGGLALTKAAFLYVGIGFIAAIALVYGVWPPPQWRRLRVFALCGVMAASMAVVVLPWMVRNFVQFESFEISQRGGLALMSRAYYNKMNDTEFKGAFYHFAKGELREVLGSYLGYSPRDLEAMGRLQRLNSKRSASFATRDLEAEKAGRPDDAISFYRAARAERNRLTKFLPNRAWSIRAIALTPNCKDGPSAKLSRTRYGI